MNRILLWGKNEERINGTIIDFYETEKGINLIMTTGVLIRLDRDIHEWVIYENVIKAKTV